MNPLGACLESLFVFYILMKIGSDQCDSYYPVVVHRRGSKGEETDAGRIL